MPDNRGTRRRTGPTPAARDRDPAATRIVPTCARNIDDDGTTAAGWYGGLRRVAVRRGSGITGTAPHRTAPHRTAHLMALHRAVSNDSIDGHRGSDACRCLVRVDTGPDSH